VLYQKHLFHLQRILIDYYQGVSSIYKCSWNFLSCLNSFVNCLSSFGNCLNCMLSPNFHLSPNQIEYQQILFHFQFDPPIFVFLKDVETWPGMYFILNCIRQRQLRGGDFIFDEILPRSLIVKVPDSKSSIQSEYCRSISWLSFRPWLSLFEVKNLLVGEFYYFIIPIVFIKVVRIVKSLIILCLWYLWTDPVTTRHERHSMFFLTFNSIFRMKNWSIFPSLQLLHYHYLHLVCLMYK